MTKLQFPRNHFHVMGQGHVLRGEVRLPGPSMESPRSRAWARELEVELEGPHARVQLVMRREAALQLADAIRALAERLPPTAKEA
jgi:hypothetical protein